MRQAMKRHEVGDAKVIPIYLRPCDWKGAPFGSLQALPTDAKPVTKWENRDEAFTIVAKGIREAVEQLTGRTSNLFDDVMAYYKQGTVYLSNGQYDLAIKYFDRAIQLEPTSHWSYYNRGLAYYFKNDFDLRPRD
jgi:tetratricopeptide (TPR) repeat protein